MTAWLGVAAIAKLREPRIRLCEGHIRWVAAKQITCWLDVAVDASFRLLVPTDIERGEFWKELKLAIRKMIVNPIRERPPIGSVGVAVCKPRNNNACRGALETSGIQVIPDMTGKVLVVRRAIVALFVAQSVDGR